jgi:hypothetical protein
MSAEDAFAALFQLRSHAAHDFAEAHKHEAHETAIYVLSETLRTGPPAYSSCSRLAALSNSCAP